MSGQRLSQHVSGISPLNGSLDGTPIKKTRAPSKRMTPPPIDTTYACARCNYRTIGQREYMAHLRAEIEELEGELSEVRDGLPRKANGHRLVAQCGTRAGRNRHRKLGEPACELCRAAVAAYSKARKSSPEHKKLRSEQERIWRARNRERLNEAKRERRRRKRDADGTTPGPLT